MHAALTVHRPQTASDALQLLSVQGNAVIVVGGAPAGGNAGLPVIDVSEVSERNGIHQLRGRIVIGLNTVHADLARSSLIRSQAACLLETSSLGASLAQTFAGGSFSGSSSPEHWPLLLALVALGAVVELAWLDESGIVRRDALPVEQAAAGARHGGAARQRPALPLAVAFAARARRTGSAFVPAPAVPGASPASLAAAVHLVLDADQEKITGVRIALAGPQGEVARAGLAEDALKGRPPSSADIAAAAREAQAFAVQAWPAPVREQGFPVQVAAHLVREAVDRAAARARDPESLRSMV